MTTAATLRDVEYLLVGINWTARSTSSALDLAHTWRCRDAILSHMAIDRRGQGTRHREVQSVERAVIHA